MSVLLTRDEFDALITPQLGTAVALVRATLSDAGVVPDRLHALYLAGGSSRIPLVHRELSRVGPVATLDDPKTVVAQGALHYARQLSYPPARSLTPPDVPVPAPTEHLVTADRGPAPGTARRFRVSPAARGVSAAIAVLVGVSAWYFTDRGTPDEPDPGVVASSAPTAAPATAGGGVTTAVSTPVPGKPPATVVSRPGSRRVTVANADLQGFADGSGPRCNSTNEAVAIGRTAESRIVVCRTGADRLYYKGIRVDDGSAVEIDDPVPAGSGFVVTNDGVRYLFDARELVISESGVELTREPMIEFWVG